MLLDVRIDCDHVLYIIAEEDTSIESYMSSVECHQCHKTFQDDTLLSLHLQYEGCGEINAATVLDNTFICPMCDKVYNDPVILHTHVDTDHMLEPVNTQSDHLYAQELDRRERMRTQYYEHASSECSHQEFQDDEDTRIARMLQEEEDAQSFEEFRNRYGGSTRTFAERALGNLERIFTKNFISSAQYNEYKSKLDAMIANPIERLESRSTGIIPILSNLPMGAIVERRLCHPGCDHISSTWLDQGWSCGYKNFQMLLSSLRHDPQHSKHLFGYDAENQTNNDVPSVSCLQGLIENAWNNGFDSEGREQFNRRLVNSTKWIGPTELMACLANLNIKTELLDFHQPKTGNKTTAFRYLFEWVRHYFQQRHGDKDAIIHPLYLQHEGKQRGKLFFATTIIRTGHSRTIVGYEQFRDGNIRLLIFDPGTPKNSIEKFRRNPTGEARIFRRNLVSFQKSVYQILVVRGLFSGNEREAAKKLRSTKVPIPNV